jgi:hypothetical protein
VIVFDQRRLQGRVDGICRKFISQTPPYDHDGRVEVQVTRTSNVERTMDGSSVRVTCRVWHNKSRPYDSYRWEPEGWRSGLLFDLAQELRREGLEVEELWQNGERDCLVVRRAC